MLKRVWVAALGAALVLFGFGTTAYADTVMSLPGSFAVNQYGAATYSMPLSTPPGSNGMAPALSLDYSSQGGNGIVGTGWTLTGLSSIGRCPQTLAQDGANVGVAYALTDRFCLDGQRLILISGTYGADGSQYRTERESFTEVIAHGTAGNGPAWFEVHTRAGKEMDFGYTTESANSQILATGTSTVRSWALSEVKDTSGNYMTVSYTADAATGMAYPASINYTGNSAAGVSPYNSVQFVYTTRSDSAPAYQAGSVVQITKLLSDVKTYNGATMVSDYRLSYQTSGASGRSELKSVQLYGADGATALPATNFTWQGQSTLMGLPAVTETNISASNPEYLAGDFSGSGRQDVICTTTSPGSGCQSLYLANKDGTYTQSGSIPSTWYPAMMYTGDWNGDGKTDVAIYSVLNKTLTFYLSTGTGFNTTTPYATISNIPGGLPTAITIGDFNGRSEERR